MQKSNEYKLKRKFKFLSPRLEMGPYPYNLFGIECGDGWYKLIYGLCTKIERELAKDKELKKSFAVTQIKEKFGGLRFYCSDNLVLHDIIAKAEDESFKICEECGRLGKRINIDGWFSTLCKKCESVERARRKSE